MANATPGKFEVDVTALGLGAGDLAELDKTIRRAVLSHLVGIDTGGAEARAFGPPGHTRGIRIVKQDLKTF